MNWLLMNQTDRQNRMATVRIRRRSFWGRLWNWWRAK